MDWEKFIKECHEPFARIHQWRKPDLVTVVKKPGHVLPQQAQKDVKALL